MSSEDMARPQDMAARSWTGSAGSRRTPVIALHCSGADGNQWNRLANLLGPSCDVIAPSFIGCASMGPWHGGSAFTLMDEACAIIDIVDAFEEPAHLVGHSYGGGVALKVASVRPDRIASLALYEPSAFHILHQLGTVAAAELAEIESIAATVSLGLVSGNYEGAAADFVEYWGGHGAWTAMRPAARDGILRWLPKAPLDFRALLDEGTPLASYRLLGCPVLIMQGELARTPSRLISQTLAREMPNACLEVLEGAGHMGPLTHASCVLARIARHINTNRPVPSQAPDALAA